MHNIEITHNKTISSMRQYFRYSDSPFIQAVCREDDNLSPLNLGGELEPNQGVTPEQVTQEWHSKALHGRYPGSLEKSNVDKKESLTYLRAGYLFPETEGRLVAIQDQVIPTRAYIKNITGRNILTDKCRRCSQATESVQHVTSSCPILAPTDYTERHNAMAKVYHQAIAAKAGLINKIRKPFEYRPCRVLENDNYRLYWDTTVETNRPIPHNRPDLMLINKKERQVIIMDVSVLADDNISRAFTEKISKYQELAFEIKSTQNLRTAIFHPLIISTNGLVEQHLKEITLSLGLEKEIISTAQKEVILGTTRIVRKFLATC